MKLRITTDMLDYLGGGNGHSVDGCKRVRELLAAAGIEDSPELHSYETTEVNRLRTDAAALSKRADAIEERGPWPSHAKRWDEPR